MDNPFLRAAALIAAVRDVDGVLATRMFNAIAANDGALADTLADAAIDRLADARDARRRVAADRAAQRAELAARAEHRKDLVEIDVDKVINEAAEHFANALMLASRPAYLKEVSSNG